MCGILAVIGHKELSVVKELSKRMSHRGPDESDAFVNNSGYILCHERLSIIDLTTGKQPIQGTDTAHVIHNGEIYNHQELRDGLLKDHTFRTTSDSEVIVHLYEKFGYDFCNMLDGVFAFVVVDGDKFIAGRDPIGVKPMYWGKDAEGVLYFSSEMKAIADQCIEFNQFPPGHYYTPETGFVRYYNPDWFDASVAVNPADLSLLRDTLTEATRKRLMSDVPYGVLLSGGLDSSIISSIAKRLTLKMGVELHSFSVALDATAPDSIAAREVAAFLGTNHHEIFFDVHKGIETLSKIVWHLETYDVTTIRASIPMYYLSKAITDRGIKVVLSGEGSDEIFGGYLYFHNAPNDQEFQEETIRRVQRLATADCLRADKSTMANGLEARVPFLDKQFLSVAMKMEAKHKRPNRSEGRIEKYILRKAFEDKENPFLPEHLLWRQKEQFSDGVGYNWIDSLIAYCSEQVSDEQMLTAAALYPHNTPTTKEAFYYRSIFESMYPQQDAIKSVLKWVPSWQENTDPSGRAANIHEKHQGDLGIGKVSSQKSV
jgi:asparagine synthase (glutamine-hydrolysing)